MLETKLNRSILFFTALSAVANFALAEPVDFSSGREWQWIDPYNVTKATNNEFKILLEAQEKHRNSVNYCIKRSLEHITFFSNGDDVFELNYLSYMECLLSDGSSEQGRAKKNVSVSYEQ